MSDYPKIFDEPKKAESKKVTIDPITRLEGHGSIEIFLDDAGNVSRAYWVIPELRGFEKFCVGRNVVELNQITSRLCGVCPGAHHLCGSKALDNVFKTEMTSAGKKLRELFYQAHFIHSHIAHFYALAAPDFVVGPAADPAERNILGLVGVVGLELGKLVLETRARAQDVQAILGGKATHPVCGIPGGMSKVLSEEDRVKMEEWGKGFVGFGKTSLDVFRDIVLKNKTYLDIVLNKDLYYHETNYMGLVDKDNKLNVYDGELRVVEPDGKEYVKFHPDNYLDHIGEHVEQWSYMKFPFLKNKGWKGFVDGKDSGVYRVAPLARVNVCDGFTTPEAQWHYEQMYEVFGLKTDQPIHYTLAFHWARLIELLHNAERFMDLITDPEITSTDIKSHVYGEPGRGVGCLEAPRGTLIHDYTANEKHLATDVNLIVGTTHNNAPMNMSVEQAASGLIKDGMVSNGLLNMVEMAYRAYDPCNSCATHALPGQLPLEVNIRRPDGELYKQVKRL